MNVAKSNMKIEYLSGLNRCSGAVSLDAGFRLQFNDERWTPFRPKHLVVMADSPQLSLILLGAGQEVGRSCCVLQYRGKTIVCDAGVHPAHSGLASLPFLDELDWSKVDAILITQ